MKKYFDNKIEPRKYRNNGEIMIPMRRGFDSSTCIFDENVLVPAPLFTAQTCIVIISHPVKNLKLRLFDFLVASNHMMVSQNVFFTKVVQNGLLIFSLKAGFILSFASNYQKNTIILCFLKHL